MYWSRPPICSLYPCINRYCQWTDDIWIYDIIESGTLFLSSSLLLPILFPFFVSCPFPFSAFVLNFPLSQSPAVLPICIFQVFYMYCFSIFPPSHFNTFALLFPFVFALVFLFKFVVPWQCLHLHPGLAVASGFNFTIFLFY